MVEPRIHPPPPPTTPRLAPWDAVQELCNKLDRLIAVLEAWAPAAPPAPPVEWPGWEPITQKLDELIDIMAGVAPAPPPEWPGWEPVISKLDEIRNKLEVWVAKEPEEIYKKAIRATGTFYSDRMVNWTKGKRLLLRVDSTLNQSAQIQAIGNIRNTREGAVDINSALTCDANGRITIGLAWDDWQPYIGCKITVSTAPASGDLTIEAVIQE